MVDEPIDSFASRDLRWLSPQAATEPRDYQRDHGAEATNVLELTDIPGHSTMRRLHEQLAKKESTVDSARHTASQ